jgi:hypothetical protein
LTALFSFPPARSRSYSLRYFSSRFTSNIGRGGGGRGGGGRRREGGGGREEEEVKAIIYE